MTNINVVITRALEKALLEQIAGVDPSIKITDASDLFAAEENGDLTAKNAFDLILSQAEIICAFWPIRNIMSRAPKLKWFHTFAAGTDQPEYGEMLKGQVILTNSSGIHGTQISELAFMLMLNLAKQALFYFKMQQEKKWPQNRRGDLFPFRSPTMPKLLEGKTLGIVGLGNIGKAIARLGKAFNMRVIAVRRSVTEITRTENVDVLMPAGNLINLLSDSDFVVLAIPATPETNKFIGEKEFLAMKRTAYLINIARGKVVDEQTLIRALKDHWIAGAGLDTVANEPLSPQSELWELPNVIITPHISGRREDYHNLAIPIFCDNLKRYINHEEMLNMVDKTKRY